MLLGPDAVLRAAWSAASLLALGSRDQPRAESFRQAYSQSGEADHITSAGPQHARYAPVCRLTQSWGRAGHAVEDGPCAVLGLDVPRELESE
jgi:hypothetical protein